MTDARIRERERIFKDSGAVGDEVQLLVERFRTAAIEPAQLRLAAHCGHVAAARAGRLLGVESPEGVGLQHLIRALRALRPEVLAPEVDGPLRLVEVFAADPSPEAWAPVCDAFLAIYRQPHWKHKIVLGTWLKAIGSAVMAPRYKAPFRFPGQDPSEDPPSAYPDVAQMYTNEEVRDCAQCLARLNVTSAELGRAILAPDDPSCAAIRDRRVDPNRLREVWAHDGSAMVGFWVQETGRRIEGMHPIPRTQPIFARITPWPS